MPTVRYQHVREDTLRIRRLIDQNLITSPLGPQVAATQSERNARSPQAAYCFSVIYNEKLVQALPRVIKTPARRRMSSDDRQSVT